MVSANFPSPPALAITNFDVQQGLNERSFIRYLDVTVNTDNGVAALIGTVNDGDADNDRIRLRRFELDDDGRLETVKHFCRLLGEVNGDRRVNSTDIGLINAANGKTGAKMEEDVNGDGAVNVVDLMLAFGALGRSLKSDLDLDD